jgi:hypothetical protein
MSANFVLDSLFGFTRQHTYQEPPGGMKCWGAEVGILHAGQPPLQRDYAMPRVDIALPAWSSSGNGIRVNDNTASVFDYLDPQWQWVLNGGWNRGTHNVKFGIDIHRLHMNHYGSRRRASPSAAVPQHSTAALPKPVQRHGGLPAGPADFAQYGAAEPAAQ